MDDSISHFWDKYINKTVSYGVPEGVFQGRRCQALHFTLCKMQGQKPNDI